MNPKMIDMAALFIPSPVRVERCAVTSQRLSALQLTRDETQEKMKLGDLCQLPPGAKLEVCGPGFNERTVKVRCDNAFYFVFRQDIEN